MPKYAIERNSGARDVIDVMVAPTSNEAAQKFARSYRGARSDRARQLTGGAYDVAYKDGDHSALTFRVKKLPRGT